MTPGGSNYFRTYHQGLQRIHVAEMLDEYQQAQRPRRLSIVGPCYTQEQWLAAAAERRRALASAKGPTAGQQ